MEFKNMTVEELEARRIQIGEEVEKDGADLDALEAEIKGIKAELEARKEAAAQKAEIRNAVASGDGKVVAEIPTQEKRTMEEIKYNAQSPEYRTAWLKNIAQRDGQMIFGDLTETEQRAFTFTTANTGAVVPTETMNRIVELVESMAPMYDDATKTGMVKGFGVPRHKSIAAGDAAATDEGVANADEEDTFDLLALDGVEIKKHVEITRKMQWQSIDAFEAWLTDHIAKRIAVAKEAQIRARLDAVATGIAAANVLTAQTYAEGTIRAILAKIKQSGTKVWYANTNTIWNGLAGIQDGNDRPLFVPSTLDSDPTIQGRIYGGSVKVDENLADNVAYVGVPASILANDFEALFMNNAIDPKTFKTIIAGYSLFDAGLENPFAFVKVTFTA
ncbi:MAG: phage major capsid protein [Lachnospiraceae bacterium]|nr:phage major capsid protein [Lachnospiraceae bacterium]